MNEKGEPKRGSNRRMWTDMDSYAPYMKNERMDCTLNGARRVLNFNLTAPLGYGSLSTTKTEVGSLGVRIRGDATWTEETQPKGLLGANDRIVPLITHSSPGCQMSLDRRLQ